MRANLTRIMMRIMATEPQAALAGVALKTSLTRLRPSMAMFSVERAPSRSFGRWELPDMVKTQGGSEEVVRC